MVESATPALNRSRETRAATQSGYLMLLVWLLLAGVAAPADVGARVGEDQEQDRHGQHLVETPDRGRLHTRQRIDDAAEAEA